MTISQSELLKYLQDFIINIKEGGVTLEQIQTTSTFEELGLESMDFVELRVWLMDDYKIDLFNNLPSNLKCLSLEEFSQHLWDVMSADTSS